MQSALYYKVLWHARAGPAAILADFEGSDTAGCISAAANDSTQVGLPTCCLNRRSYRGGAGQLCAARDFTGGREDGRAREAEILGSRCRPRARSSISKPSDACRRRGEQQNPRGPPVLPSACESRRFSARVIRTAAARDVPFGETEGSQR